MPTGDVSEMPEEDYRLADGVSEHTGFPNPATDTSLRSLNLNELLIAHSASTYFFRVRGNNWEASGVFDGDIAVIDRSLTVRKSDTVVWWNHDSGQFSISPCSKVTKEAVVWGVVTATIHQFRKVKLDGK